MNENTIKKYQKYGIDVYSVINTLKQVPISIQCWQLDDVTGFENSGALTGGIQATGSYPFRARCFDELKQDLEEAFKHIPGTKKINIHASYQTNDVVDRSDITINQYQDWLLFAKLHNIGLDFNPTIFSSPMLVDGLSLSSPKKEVRDYWIKHCKNSIKVTNSIAKFLNKKSLCNIWIPDGLKDEPIDRIGYRQRLKESLDEILETPYDKDLMDISVESKVFGIGVESFTTGSNEFYINYALSRGILCLLDTGHFHPTENVADKISSMVLFNKKLAFHVSRPVRWDSDHVLRLNDDLQEVANELVKCGCLENAYIGLDYFDASINRVAALIIGARNMQKALLKALLTPWHLLKTLESEADFTKVLAWSEEIKTLPWEEVWNDYCIQEQISLEDEWYDQIKQYENKVLSKRK